MKKNILIFLTIILISLLVISCKDDKRYSIQLEVHYPSRIENITVEGDSWKYPILRSSEGTNYIYGFYATTAPIKIISITEIPLKKQ
jgi:hypothetical protein